MGFLLKIILFGVAIWGVWVTVRRWYGLLGGFGKPQAPPPARREAAPPPQAPSPTSSSAARPAPVEDTQMCPRCGAYVLASAIGRPCPHT